MAEHADLAIFAEVLGISEEKAYLEYNTAYGAEDLGFDAGLILDSLANMIEPNGGCEHWDIVQELVPALTETEARTFVDLLRKIQKETEA